MRTRSYRHLSAKERETLSLSLDQGHSLRTMASVLGRAPSTVSREYTLNAGRGKTLRHVPALLRNTLTYDRVKEMAEHKRLTERLAILIFIADPYSLWQRGTNENTNGLATLSAS